MMKAKNKRARSKILTAAIGRFSMLLFCVLTFSFLLCSAASAQDDQIESAPPPLKLMSKDEQTRLDAKPDIKDRTKLSVELMNARLTAAEKLSAAKNFEGMYVEFGYFHALMDDALGYLNKKYDGRGKVLDNFKRLEISLRGMAPRIEVIRRDLPLRFDPYVRKLMGYLRSVRAQATDSLFSDSVIPTVRKPD
jgi:hypothetical protein